MLRVGLTGGLGVGKTTVTKLFARTGIHTLDADEVGRELMQPGQRVYAAIVSAFGQEILLPDGRIDRRALAEEAFSRGRLRELNAIVHPAVIEEQIRWMETIAERDPQGIAMIESALLFEAEAEAQAENDKPGKEKPSSLLRRFDKLILVTASDGIRIARFLSRSAGGCVLTRQEQESAEADARRRIARQIPDQQKRTRCDYVIENERDPIHTEVEVQRIADELFRLSRTR